jgi:hypothetical protein
MCRRARRRRPHGNGGKIAYYEHAWATRRQACLNQKIFDHEPRRVLAKILEPKVWDRVAALLSDPSYSQILIDSALATFKNENRAQDTDRLRSKIRGIDDQIQALAEHLAKIPKGLSPTPIFAQMKKLEALKKAGQEELDDILRTYPESHEATTLRSINRVIAT